MLYIHNLLPVGLFDQREKKKKKKNFNHFHYSFLSQTKKKDINWFPKFYTTQKSRDFEKYLKIEKKLRTTEI